MFATLSLVAFFCFIYLRYKKINLFDKNEFKFDQGLNQVFYKAFFIAILILIGYMTMRRWAVRWHSGKIRWSCKWVVVETRRGVRITNEDFCGWRPES